MIIHSADDAGHAIRARRKHLGYTQREISDASGFSISFISDIENGKPTAEIEKVITLMNLLGIDLSITERGQ